jgi:sugar phosphate isomerase/epimerase
VELVLASHCLADVSFPERVEAAAAAGFDGIGLSLEEYDRAHEAGLSDADLAALLDAHDLAWTELESVRSVDHPRPPELDRLLRIGERFGVRRLQAIGSFAAAEPGPGAVELFADVCTRAASAGMEVALEFLPPTSIPDVATAARLVAEAGRDNGGLCVDAWHFFRGGGDFAALEQLPSGSVLMLQLDDGTLRPRAGGYLPDTLDNRLLPGKGEFDLARLLSVLSNRGNLRAVSAEVLSSCLRQLPAHTAAALIADASRALLATTLNPTSKEAS